MSDQNIRINAPLLDKFVSHTVRIVGKVTDVRGDTAVIDAKGPITLILGRVLSPYPSSCSVDVLVDV